MNVTSPSNELTRYVPRLSAEWQLHTPGAWREIDASLCYIDISGFTALSEKLARRGRIGAEELTEVLDHVFGRMLTVAYDRGGSLLKFGGDALLLMFVGADHPVQACSAAVEMRTVLRDARAYRTSAGRLDLKMSVGIHRGLVHAFRVGASHRELIVSGPAASMTTEMEETATAGEILVSPATAAALPPNSCSGTKGGGHLLAWRRAKAPGPGWSPRVTSDPTVLEAATPVALRDHLGGARPEPEHHIATVGFLKFRGVDALMASGGPDAVADALDTLVVAVQQAVDAEGVTFLASDIDADGGKIIVVGGVPVVQEDDEGRVLRAARRIIDSAGPLQVQMGLNRGHVYVGEVGTDFRATYTIMGDTVNLAARLMAAAAPGELYATPSVLDHSLTLFETTPLEPFHVKGKQHPVQAYRVGAETARRPAERRRGLPFVGRAAERAELHTALEDLRTGAGRAVAVVGERGVGKSRLVDEVVRTLDGIHHFEIRAEPYGAATPYRPLRDPLRLLLGIEPGEPDDMCRQLRAAVTRLLPHRLSLLALVGDVTMIPEPDGPEVALIDPQFRHDRTADVLIELLEHLCPGPLLIEVEDAHHMDASTAHVLARVASETDHRPWLVLTTRQPGAGSLGEAERQLALGPLADDEAREMVLMATERAPLRPHDVETIVRRAGGLPLFLEGIIGAVRASGGFDDLPESIDAVVSARLDALPPLPRRLLLFSSVLGLSFRTSILARLVEAEGIRVDAATRRSLSEFLEPVEAGRLRFRHAMIRDVAYEGLSYRRRRELHRRAGEAVEEAAGAHTDEQADTLALHFFLAQDNRRAWHYSLVAGRIAHDACANPEAVAHYRRALESARRLREIDDRAVADVWVALGDVSERSGHYEDSVAAYRRAARLVDDQYRRLDLTAKRAMVRRHSASYRAALRETALGLKQVGLDLTAAGQRAQARLLVERSSVRRYQQRPAEALPLAVEAERLARNVGDLETLALALVSVGWAQRMLGHGDGITNYEEALDIFERLGDMAGVALVSNNLGGEAYFEGRWDLAVQAYQRSLEAELRNGNDVAAAIPAGNIAEVLISQGRLDEAEPLLVDAIRVMRASGYPAAGFFETELARLHIHRGDYAAAEALLDRITAEGLATDEPASVLNAAIQRADSVLRQGNVTDALSLLDQITERAGEMAEVLAPVLGRLRAAALVSLGRSAEAVEQVDLALEHARRQGLLYDQALLLAQRHAMLVAGGRATDDDDLAEAQRLFATLGIRSDSSAVLAQT